jgi:protein-tyrosine-phosphatase
MHHGSEDAGLRRTILFVCIHGSAKSLIAAEHLNRLARSRGLDVRGESAGVDPDGDVPSPVIVGLAADGIDVTGFVPRRVTAEQITAATRIVSFGCDLGYSGSATKPVEQWDDLPMVSDGYSNARDAIVARVETLLGRSDGPRSYKGS